jgi:hypothetical protein
MPDRLLFLPVAIALGLGAAYLKLGMQALEYSLELQSLCSACYSDNRSPPHLKPARSLLGWGLHVTEVDIFSLESMECR